MEKTILDLIRTNGKLELLLNPLSIIWHGLRFRVDFKHRKHTDEFFKLLRASNNAVNIPHKNKKFVERIKIHAKVLDIEFKSGILSLSEMFKIVEKELLHLDLLKIISSDEILKCKQTQIENALSELVDIVSFSNRILAPAKKSKT
jgi:hypothetical protein